MAIFFFLNGECIRGELSRLRDGEFARNTLVVNLRPEDLVAGEFARFASRRINDFKIQFTRPGMSQILHRRVPLPSPTTVSLPLHYSFTPTVLRQLYHCKGEFTAAISGFSFYRGKETMPWPRGASGRPYMVLAFELRPVPLP